jgi:hypothetical protein
MEADQSDWIEGRSSPMASFVAAQQSDWGNADAASVDGINLRDGVTAKLDG